MFVERLKSAYAAFIDPAIVKKPSASAAKTKGRMVDLSEFDTAFKKHPLRNERFLQNIQIGIEKTGLTGGRMLEIGGRKNPLKTSFPQFDYMSADLEKSDPSVIVADITDCPHIESESFDVIVSVDVFEHINAPWLAAKEITRLLKPGGFTYHTTLFSWRYHPCPIDYWRYTPDALAYIFSDLETVTATFDDAERRRNITGKGGSRPIEEDGMGGWRENWRVHYLGVKPEAGA